ncbi:MAG TPA: ChbG/HpnK family deacetylase [Candidatus Limnocylindrales bacterium]|nr:ChbG/HpnK family deacetylase [Candidatus Limnocylindrales bacterium]
MKYLIINADDFGLTPEVSRGILQTVREGIVTSTTVLINSPHVGELPELLKTRVGIGLHFNLTWGSPVSSPEEVPSLIDEKGFFHSDPSFLGPEGESVYPRKSEEIQKELEAQVERFLRLLQKPPTHIDVHKHAHKYPTVLNPLIRVAKKYRIPVRAINSGMRTVLQENGLVTTDFFMGGALPEGPYWTKEQLLTTLIQVQPGVTEIMCHPGYVPEPIPGMFYNQQREVELRSFCDPEVQEEIKKQGIQLVDFSFINRP